MIVQKKKAYFIGIKGVGMTSLALAMQDAGWEIWGSDTAESFITDDILNERRITIFPLGTPVLSDMDLIVCSAAYTPPETSIRTISLAEALAEFVSARKVIAVAGVGGKTTTTAMLAALFHAAGRDVGYYVGTGSIAGLRAPGHCGTDPYFIVEADEYAISKKDKRAKFRLLTPEIVITTNIVHDHPDIYPDEGSTLAEFADLIRLIRPGGFWICNPADPLTAQLVSLQIGHAQGVKVVTYGPDLPLYKQIKLSVFGNQNRLDAVAAVLAAEAAGIKRVRAVEAILSYRGAGRRQEYHGELRGRYLYDDYGHHPGEIAVTVNSFRDRYPEARILLVFESHTYTRTETLLPDFARAIATADFPFIMPIFESAREKDKEHTITPESFAREVAKLNPHARSIDWKDAAEAVVRVSRPGDVILTMGAGFVYKLHSEFKTLLK